MRVLVHVSLFIRHGLGSLGQIAASSGDIFSEIEVRFFAWGASEFFANVRDHVFRRLTAFAILLVRIQTLVQ
jgi:hypothetical protein